MRGNAVAAYPGEMDREGVRTRRRWALVFATLILTLMRTGAYWDVHWHYAVGRDSFFIPPHDLIYAGVAVSGLLGLFIVWRDGLRRSAAVPWPSGWFMQMLGAGVMVSAAPFDELWHRWYGIDVTIWSPPHMLGVFGGWLMHAGLFASWAIEWRDTVEARWSRIVLLGLIWATTLLVSMFNFGLVPAMRWSVLQPVTPTLYSALGSLLIPGAFVALAWLTARAWTALLVLLGLVVLRLLDDPLWNFGLHYVVPLFGQSVRRVDLRILQRHFWLHPLLNAAPALVVCAIAWSWRIRRRPWGAALTGSLSGLAIWLGVEFFSTGLIMPITRFSARGQTAADFHAETDFLLRLLGTSHRLALGWALFFGAVSGLAGYAVVQRLRYGRRVQKVGVRGQESGARSRESGVEGKVHGRPSLSSVPDNRNL